ncbi:MAG: hypothetical protein AB1746_03170 [Candidatus Zixiibacteriota bacterium]
MFITLLGVTFVISLVVSFLVVLLFSKPLDKILAKIISDEISSAWSKYLKYAVYVVGISTGVRIWQLKQYIEPPTMENAQMATLDMNHWVLEVYQTIIGTLQGIAWLLLVFFVFAMIAYVIVRVAKKA